MSACATLPHYSPTVVVVVCLVSLFFCGVAGCITTIPILGHDSPYYAPLSATVLLLYAEVPCSSVPIYSHVGLETLARCYYFRCYDLRELLEGGQGNYPSAKTITGARQPCHGVDDYGSSEYFGQEKLFMVMPDILHISCEAAKTSSPGGTEVTEQDRCCMYILALSLVVRSGLRGGYSPSARHLSKCCPRSIYSRSTAIARSIRWIIWGDWDRPPHAVEIGFVRT